MALSVGVAQPSQTINVPKATSSPTPANISVGVAQPGNITGVTSDYGMQGYSPGGYSSSPLSIAVPGGTTGGGSAGGTSGSGTASGAVVDPYAAYGGQANYNNMLDAFNSQLNGITSSAGLAGQNSQLGEQTAINDYIDSVKQQQKGIDNQSVQNYLAKQQGAKGVLDMVSQGIRSGGVMLANKNATNSSAADELARAYGQQGRQQLSGVNQQFAQGQNQIDQSQQALKADMDAHIRDLPAWKTQTVNNIVSQAQQQLGSLNQTAAYEKLPPADVEAKKQEITTNVLSQLQGLDAMLAGVNNVAPASVGQNQSAANTLFQAGTVPDNAFNFTTAAPAQFQNTGNFSSDLPIFTFPGSTKNQNQTA